ncbi:MAG: SpoIVB peptidase [Ruminococcaceae bacterium]|nr:SpoIVB peptidase [Oscillospiraceae bacterium]
MHETRRPSFLRRSAALLLAILLALCCCQPVWAAEGGSRQLIPMGRAVGIKLFADGVLVVATSDLNTGGRSPAEDCGLREGDLILRIDDEEIQSTEHLQSLLQEHGEAAVTLTVRRGQRTSAVDTCAVLCDDGVYRLGVWIRDSMAGIGTLTFYDPNTGNYGALGHGITDVDTQVLMPLSSGSIMETTVRAVKKGQRGDPGELKGDFSVQRDVGTVFANTAAGIFGVVSDSAFASGGQPIPVAAPDEVHPGEAEILCTVSGDRTELYRVEITRLCPGRQDMRDLLLRVTDRRLLETTGGIVQGMSGSPIIQDGRFVGAVTHVLVNDPTQGYGILMENMLSMAG